MDLIYRNVAGLDVHRKTVVACVRRVEAQGRVREHVQTFGTMTADLLRLSDWLAGHGVTHVAMESTGVLWKPVWNILDGLMVVLASTRRDPQREIEYVAALRAQRARAVIVVGSRTTDREVTARLAKEVAGYTESGGRVACVSQNLLGTNTVLVQNRAGARDLALELAGLGHRRFAMLAGPTDLLTARDRLAGFTDGLARAGIAPDGIRVVHGPFTRDGGYAAAAELVAEGLAATCVFACNDVMAVGAMAALRERGLRVPDDVSMAGFDDIETLRDLVPPLTTVHLALEELGERAAELALDGAPGDPVRQVRVRGHVVLRASTRRLDG
jgi:LacI family transcriptional regulator